MLNSAQHTKDRFVLSKGGAQARTTLGGTQAHTATTLVGIQAHTTPGRTPSSSQNATNAKTKTTQLIRGKDALSHPLKKNMQIAALVVAICLCLCSGLSLAYFSAQDEKTYITPLESIDLTLSEEWSAETGMGYTSGLTAVKSPTITAEEGLMYTRICMKVEENVPDGEGGTTTLLITDPDRLQLIEGIFYADTEMRLQPGTPYSRHDVATIPGVYALYDPVHFFAPSSPTPGVYYFEFIGVMPEGSEATLFNKVVIPSDYSADELNLMGNFTVSFEGQGIQSFGFAYQADAMIELDKAVS